MINENEASIIINEKDDELNMTNNEPYQIEKIYGWSREFSSN